MSLNYKYLCDPFKSIGENSLLFTIYLFSLSGANIDILVLPLTVIDVLETLQIIGLCSYSTCWGSLQIKLKSTQIHSLGMKPYPFIYSK